LIEADTLETIPINL